MAFSLGYRELEAVLMRAQLIAPDKRGAFASRLRHFQRHGFPEGVNTGKGTRAEYRAEHLLMYALALDLLQIGVTPETGVAAIRKITPIVAHALKIALVDRKGDQDYKDPITLYFYPNALEALQSPMKSEDMSFSEYTFWYARSSELGARLRNFFRAGLACAAVVNVSHILYTLEFNVITTDNPNGFEDFRNAIAEWADEIDPLKFGETRPLGDASYDPFALPFDD